MNSKNRLEHDVTRFSSSANPYMAPTLEKESRVCSRCGKSFQSTVGHPYKIGSAHFCSFTCLSLARKQHDAEVFARQQRAEEKRRQRTEEKRLVRQNA